MPSVKRSSKKSSKSVGRPRKVGRPKKACVDKANRLVRSPVRPKKSKGPGRPRKVGRPKGSCKKGSRKGSKKH